MLPNQRAILLSGAFSPDRAPGLKLWLDAGLSPLWQDSARTTVASADTEPVGAWDDVSGLGNHCVQATDTKRPVIAANSLAGKRGINFVSSDCLTRAALTLSSSFSMFFVFKMSSTAGILFEHSANAGTNPGFYVYATTTASLNVRRTELTQKNVALNWAVDSVAKLLCYEHNGTHASQLARIDRVSTALTTMTENDIGISDVTDTLNLGARNDASTLPSTGLLYAVLIYTPVLTSAMRDKVENYLQSRWTTP